MSKAVLISIRPKWVEKIANGEKTIEVRKTKPKLETPFKCYIYCTLPKYPHEDFIATDYPMPQFYGGGKVIGEFTCERIVPITYDGGRLWCPTNAAFSPATCLSQAEIITYIGDKGRCYGWHISDLRIYDTPRDLQEFASGSSRFMLNPKTADGFPVTLSWVTRPPQSWCYVEEG